MESLRLAMFGDSLYHHNKQKLGWMAQHHQHLFGLDCGPLWGAKHQSLREGFECKPWRRRFLSGGSFRWGVNIPNFEAQFLKIIFLGNHMGKLHIYVNAYPRVQVIQLVVCGRIWKHPHWPTK